MNHCIPKPIVVVNGKARIMLLFTQISITYAATEDPCSRANALTVIGTATQQNTMGVFASWFTKLRGLFYLP